MSNLNTLLALFQERPALVALVMIWSLFWKGLGLWHSAQRRQTIWFVVILLVNLFGLLEIIYLFAIAKKSFRELFS